MGIGYAFLQTEIYNSRLKNISTSLINQKTNKGDKLSLPANLRRAGKSILDFSAKLKQSLCDIYFNPSQVHQTFMPEEIARTFRYLDNCFDLLYFSVE